MKLSREQLTQELNRLIRSTAWAEDKQRLWLNRKGQVDSWQQADNFLIQEAIDYLKKIDEMFDSPIDQLSCRTNTGKSVEERESLRIYFGEGEEE